jgi:hypothetical protein
LLVVTWPVTIRGEKVMPGALGRFKDAPRIRKSKEVKEVA